MKDFKNFMSFINEALTDSNSDIGDDIDTLLNESNFTPDDWNSNYGCTADSYKKRIISILLKKDASIHGGDEHSLIMDENGTYANGLNLHDKLLQSVLRKHNSKKSNKNNLESTLKNSEHRQYTDCVKDTVKADNVENENDYIEVYKFGKYINLDSFTKYAKPENKDNNKALVKRTLEKLVKDADNDVESNDGGTELTKLFFDANDIPNCVRNSYSRFNLWTAISKNGNIKTGSAGKIFEIRANAKLEDYISGDGVHLGNGDIKFVPIYNNITGKINLITKSRVVKHKNEDGSFTGDPADPKADLVLSSNMSVLKNIEVLEGDVDVSNGDKIFISYKKLSAKPVRGGAGDFSGYSGISKKSGENISSNKQVIDFACKCLMLFDESPDNMLKNDITPYKLKYAQILKNQGIEAKFYTGNLDDIKATDWKNTKYGVCPPTTSLYEPIDVSTDDGKDLVRYSMYGKDYKVGGAPGFDNCNCIIQGKVLLNPTYLTCRIKIDNDIVTLPVFELNGSHIYFNGDIPPANNKIWKMCLWAVKKEEERNDLKVVGLRVNIAPFGWRSNAIHIDKAIKSAKDKLPKGNNFKKR